MNKYIAMELNCPRWIDNLIENKDEILTKQAVKMVANTTGAMK
ncbi:hypothetical protein [uncultured Pseudodesulfovibrio sp.]|nr:hypothetical protein [uncultured Pseudodesulfovibrio sp.]